MTAQLDEQQKNLVSANKMIDSRRRFIEEVLEGVASGVLNISSDYIIQVANQTALHMLAPKSSELIGQDVKDVFPEVLEMLEDLHNSQSNRLSKTMRIPRSGALHTLRVSIVEMDEGTGQSGFILTFDEITELLSAQRKAAWGDVARRIAHEIRNPLTPIQLSAERLNRKYLKQISTDADKFEGCVETIIRQVDTIGSMVNEFSNFARMPEPKLKSVDIVKVAKQSLEQQKNLSNGITYKMKLNGLKSLTYNCDEAQFSQVFTNLLQNAADAILELEGDKKTIQLEIDMIDQTSFAICIDDSGPGFPETDREQLTEPYITNKEKGTGLGLAIVKKIVEDHGGVLTLEDSPLKGARVKLKLFIEH